MKKLNYLGISKKKCIAQLLELNTCILYEILKIKVITWTLKGRYSHSDLVHLLKLSLHIPNGYSTTTWSIFSTYSDPL